MDYVLKKAKLMAKMKMAGGSRPSQKTQLMAQMKMSGASKQSQRTQVTKRGEKIRLLDFHLVVCRSRR